MAKRPVSSPEDLDALASEYVLGVGDSESRKAFEQLDQSLTDAADARRKWENRLSGLNADYGEEVPPKAVKQRIDKRLFASVATTDVAGGGLWNALSFWRGLGIVGSAAAIALGVYSVRLGDDLEKSGTQLTAALDDKKQVESQLQAFETEIASRGKQLDELETQLSKSNERAEGLVGELAAAEQRIAEADALLLQARADLRDVQSRERNYQVVSLESAETDYRFLAVHEAGSDEVRMTLVSGEIENQQDYELWLVEPDVEVVSLGVVPSGKTSVSLDEKQVAVLEKGGLLAISIEQKGGSPTGVAQGPVVAVGAPNDL